MNKFIKNVILYYIKMANTLIINRNIDFLYQIPKCNLENNINEFNKMIFSNKFLNIKSNNSYEKEFKIIEDSEIIINNKKKKLKLKLNFNDNDFIKRIDIPKNVKSLFEDIYLTMNGNKINNISLNELLLQCNCDIYLHLIVKNTNIKKIFNNVVHVTYSIVNDKPKFRLEYD